MSLLPYCRLMAGLVLLLQPLLVFPQNQPEPTPQDTARLIAEQEQRRLADPATGTVPYERLDEVRGQLKNQSIPVNGAPAAPGGIANITWQERGPNNIGGRTRALLFDPNDPAHKKVWAGSLGGGLWYTNDITDAGSAWAPVSDTWENTVVTALAADPSNPQVMYAGTGDMFNYVTGGGIWKTTDGGTTWTRLSSTIPGGSYPSIGQSFSYIHRILINSAGQVFAATQYGLVRSMDGGTSWAFVLAPNQAIGVSTAPTGSYANDKVTSLEIGTDGILYAGFNPSRVFKSTNTAGTSWVDITPAGASGSERTELALATSTSGASQVIYAASRAYNAVNYGKDIKWFKKSSNGGVTWTDVTIPVFSSGDHFTSGNGAYALDLAVHPTDANLLYAGGNSWFRSVDGGNSWSGSISNVYISYQGLVFQPGSTLSAVFCSEKGVYWSSNWNDTALTQPTILDRNNGYRAIQTNAAAMKPGPGSAYLLGTSRNGAFKLTANGLSAGSVLYSASYDMGPAFIDEETPNSQVFISSGGSVVYYDGTSSQSLTSLGSSGEAADYDSPANTLYIADYNYSTSQYFLRKITGIGSSVAATQAPLTGITNALSYLKLSKDRTTLVAGSYPGKLYRISNLSQATPTVTAIDNGAFPQYTTISCIDVGATDNELLVTLSNFGVQSVWYTSDGGNSWVGKDQSNYGLPDVPVRTAIFNPQNRKQVLLGTDAGIWLTSDITAANPAWAASSTGMGPFRINQLRYRASDGRVTAATYGRGIWTTDAWAIPHTPSTITLTNVSNTVLCAGNTVSVSFSTSGPALSAGTSFDVWVSDATGSFTNQRRLGSGTTSPISVTLSSDYTALPFGTNYRFKVIAPIADVESSPSEPLAIGDLLNSTVTDRRGNNNSSYSSTTICPNSRMTILAQPRNGGFNTTSAEGYQWLLNGSPVSGATSQTILAEQAGNYQAVIRQAGCTVQSTVYQLSVSSSPSPYVISSTGSTPQCDDRPQTLRLGYLGETATYQWTLDGISIAGATSSTLAASQSGTYGFRITDGSCSATASPQPLSFGRSLFALGMYGGVDSILCAGSSLSSYLYASQVSSDQMANGTYSIQWYRDNVLLTGSTSSYYYAYQPGAYTFELKQGSCTTRSNVMAVSQGALDPPTISYSFRSKTACPGENRYLYISNSGSGSFQWQKDGVDIAGAITNSYVATGTGSYTVRITRGVCSATSLPVSLTFSTAIQPVINLAWSSTGESCSGANPYANDAFTMSGYQYQWYRNGTLLSGETGSGLYTTQSGAYTVRVTNGNCTGLAKEVYINNNNGVTAKPIISASLKSLQLCQGNSLLLTASSYIGTLQWKRNGIAIPGSTRNEFYATQSGLYAAVSQDGSCSAESDPVEVKIGEATTASLSGNAFISAGQSAKLPVAFTGPAPWSFTLTNGQSVTATYQNPYLIPVAPTTNTTYQLASVINACGTGVTSGQASVSVGTGSADVSLNMIVNNRSPNVGDVVSYTLSAFNAGPDNATGVQLSSLLPAGLSFVSSPSPGVSAASGLVSANLGTMAVNGQSTVSFLASPTLPGTFATTAQITASQTPDPDSQPNSGTGDGQDDQARVDLRTTTSGSLADSPNPNQVPLPKVASSQPPADPNTADLSLSMRVDKLIPTTSDLISTSLTVSNGGGSWASSIVVQVVLPNGAALPVSQSGWVQVDGQTYKGYINQLAAGQSAMLVLTWQATSNGTLKAQVLDVSEADLDSTPGNGYGKGEDDEAALIIRIR